MNSRGRMLAGVCASVALAGPGAASAAAAPSEVVEFAKAGLQRCANPSGNGVLLTTDLNGDGVPEWVVADGGPACPGSAKIFTLTVFTTVSGKSRPAFQHGVAGYRLERQRLWIALQGFECLGNKPDATCDRPIDWVKDAKLFVLAAPSATRQPSQIKR